MDITSVSTAGVQTLTEKLPSIERAEDVDLFTNMLFEQPTLNPGEMIIASLQDKSLSISNTINNARATVDVLNNPATMLTAQSFLKNAMVEVDLIAKVTGQLSQGINKLVSMQ